MTPAGLRADEDRDRVQRRIPRDAHRRLDLGEAPRRRLGCVGREQRRVVLEIGDMGLVRGRSPGAQLLEREHHLDGIELGGDACQPRRGQAA